MKEEEEGTSNMEDKIEVEAIDKNKKVEDIKAETTIEISKEEVVTEEEIKAIDRVVNAEETEEIEEIEEIEMVDKTIIEETMMSRATITALVDLKYPRQATYVKQANIAHGAQQVNNGTAPQANGVNYAQAHTPAKEIENSQNKLLEATHAQQGNRMDNRAPQKAKRGH